MILKAEKLIKSNHSAAGEKLNILDGVDFTIDVAQTAAITGASGSGKTTLLSLLSGLDEVDSGTIEVMGKHLQQMSEKDLTLFRAQNMGIVFQHFYLMQHFSALENIALPLEILRYRRPEIKQLSEAYLHKVGLTDRADHMPAELSGGEIQRIAIARALITRPKVLFADEPTGNLDSINATKIADLLFQLVEQEQMSLVLVTHNDQLARRCQTVYRIAHGKLQKQSF